SIQAVGSVSVMATLTGVFDGITATAILPLMTFVGEGNHFFGPPPINDNCPTCFAFDQILAGHPNGPHTSTLVVTMMGAVPAEFHFERSPESTVTPLPE